MGLLWKDGQKILLGDVGMVENKGGDQDVKSEGEGDVI